MAEGSSRAAFAALARPQSASSPRRTPPGVPQGNAITERGPGAMIGITRNLMTGAPHLPHELRGGAATTATCSRATGRLRKLSGARPPQSSGTSTSLGSLEHIHEWGCAARRRFETRHRGGRKLGAQRAEKTLPAWVSILAAASGDCGIPSRVTISARVSFRDTSSRDVKLRRRERPRLPVLAEGVDPSGMIGQGDRSDGAYSPDATPDGRHVHTGDASAMPPGASTSGEPPSTPRALPRITSATAAHGLARGHRAIASFCAARAHGGPDGVHERLEQSRTMLAVSVGPLHRARAPSDLVRRTVTGSVLVIGVGGGKGRIWWMHLLNTWQRKKLVAAASRRLHAMSPCDDVQGSHESRACGCDSHAILTMRFP